MEDLIVWWEKIRVNSEGFVIFIVIVNNESTYYKAIPKKSLSKVKNPKRLFLKYPKSPQIQRYYTTLTKSFTISQKEFNLGFNVKAYRSI